MVEIEAQKRELLAACQLFEAIRNFFVEQVAIGEIRQSVVQRHMRDFGLGVAAFGDVFMSGDPAAARARACS